MFDVLSEYWPEFLSGFWVTCRLVAFSFVVAMVVGTLVAAFRIAPNKWLQRLGGIYVEVFRNIPLLVLLFISYARLRRAVDVRRHARIAGDRRDRVVLFRQRRIYAATKDVGRVHFARDDPFDGGVCPELVPCQQIQS